jgi:hypothetical protein
MQIRGVLSARGTARRFGVQCKQRRIYEQLKICVFSPEIAQAGRNDEGPYFMLELM